MDSTTILFILYIVTVIYTFFKNKDSFWISIVCTITYLLHFIFSSLFLNHYNPNVDGNLLFMYYGGESVINLLLSLYLYLISRDNITTISIVCVMVWVSLLRCIISGIDPSSNLLYDSYTTIILILNLVLLYSLIFTDHGGSTVGTDKDINNNNLTVRSSENYLHNLNELCEKIKNKKRRMNNV